MTKPFYKIPLESQTKASDYIQKIQEFNKELKSLKIPIQLQMTLTEQFKSNWDLDENYYWRDTVKLFNSMAVFYSDNVI